MSKNNPLTQITRSLIVGASAGTMALTQVGCAPTLQAEGTILGTPTKIAVSSPTEQELCEQVMRTRSVGYTDQLMRRYPNSRCVAPVLNALPSETLGGLSPDALTKLSPVVVRGLSQRVRAQLPVQLAQASAADSDDDEDAGISRY